MQKRVKLRSYKRKWFKPVHSKVPAKSCKFLIGFSPTHSQAQPVKHQFVHKQLSPPPAAIYSMGHKKGMTLLSHLLGTLLCGTLSMSQEHRQAMLILAIVVYLQMFLHSWTKCSIRATSQGTCTCMCMCILEAIVHVHVSHSKPFVGHFTLWNTVTVSRTQMLIWAIAVHLQCASVLTLLDEI